jgi:excisionase family DNA binding protein
MDEVISRLDQIIKILQDSQSTNRDTLTVEQASDFLNISTSQLYKLTSTHQIPFYCPNGKKIYFKKYELEAWIQKSRRISSDELDIKAADYLIKNKKR